MAAPRPPDPALLVVAAFSRHPGALAWGRSRLEAEHGPVALASDPFDFTQTRYYEAEMGPGLKKQLWGFRDFVRPDCLADVKRGASEMESACASSGAYP